MGAEQCDQLIQDLEAKAGLHFSQSRNFPRAHIAPLAGPHKLQAFLEVIGEVVRSLNRRADFRLRRAGTGRRSGSGPSARAELLEWSAWCIGPGAIRPTCEPRRMQFIPMRKKLADYLAEQAEWRWRKAEEYPEDPRNARSAEALGKLAAYVRSLSAEDPIFIGLESVQATEADVYLPGDEGRALISRYGFRQEPENPHSFLERVLEAAERDQVEFVEEAEQEGWLD